MKNLTLGLLSLLAVSTTAMANGLNCSINDKPDYTVALNCGLRNCVLNVKLNSAATGEAIPLSEKSATATTAILQNTQAKLEVFVIFHESLNAGVSARIYENGVYAGDCK